MRKGEFQSVGDALDRDPEARRQGFRAVRGRAPSCSRPRAGPALTVLPALAQT